MGRGYSSFGNTTSLGSSGRTGSSILVSGTSRGSFSRILSTYPIHKRQQLFQSEITFLYGPNGSAYRRGLSP